MAERLKDMFFTKESVGALADTLKKHHRKFDKRAFLGAVFDSAFDGLELKQRMRHTTECMHLELPSAYDRAVKILRKAAPNVKGFEAMCLPDYVECFGLDNWELSLEAMALSEFQRAPDPILPILEKLKDDESEFMRKSVANNLNDISKDHPDRVLELCESWYGKSKRTDWVVKHACRTMLKAGNRRAMLLFGFGDPKRVDVKRLKLSHKVLAIGDQLEFSFALKLDTKKTCKVRLEYVVTFAKASGKSGTNPHQGCPHGTHLPSPAATISACGKNGDSRTACRAGLVVTTSAALTFRGAVPSRIRQPLP